MNPSNASGTVTSDSPGASVVQNAIANAAAGPQMPLADQSDAIYDKQTKGNDEPAKPTEVPETPKETPAPAENANGQPAELEGYFADEGLEDEPSTPPPAPASTPQPLPASFSPEEQYIAQNIGQPITVRIKVGDQVQAVQAYSPDNLPENFEYASERDRTQALLGFDRLTRKAEKLQADYQTQQQQQQVQNFSEQEDRDIQRDIAALQRLKVAGKDGLDLFKYSPDDPRFEDDPAVKEMQEVLDFYNKERDKRWLDSQRTGRQFRPLTYADAFKIWRADNPKVGPKQQEEDTQRKNITRPLAKAAKSAGESAGTQQRPKLPRNASIDQIISAYYR